MPTACVPREPEAQANDTPNAPACTSQRFEIPPWDEGSSSTVVPPTADGAAPVDGAKPWRTRLAGPGLRGDLPPPVYARLLELTDTRKLVDAADARARIDELAAHLVSAGDPRGLFAVVYRLITNRAEASVREGAYAHTEWARVLIVRFAARYLDNLAGDLRGGNVTPPWGGYYDLARNPSASRAQTLGVGIVVHLMDDLPRTLAEIGSTPAHERDFMVFGEILLEVFPDLVRDVRAAYGADVRGLLSGLAAGVIVDAVAGQDATTRALYQAIRWKAWIMGQKLQSPLERPLAQLEVTTSLAGVRAALRHLAATGAI